MEPGWSWSWELWFLYMGIGVSTCSVPATLTKHGLGVKDVVFICVNLNEETLKRSEMNKSGGKETDWE